MNPVGHRSRCSILMLPASTLVTHLLAKLKLSQIWPITSVVIVVILLGVSVH
ncbi:hypothetical protein LIPSTDRAFT_74593 [Lipomyces starkeyi NRRL Y-11557]|uniref:Uncharacterized protein n=1 Tax=Lipomyces starkeyi NRRL Y-11557 TaxID=675824 RepID=A0A1E3PY05_LIPST|nr:hypothetical protein LIPSTDRAFT_74593 [Lipomyces starkeyi NRRL Y-11557]